MSSPIDYTCMLTKNRCYKEKYVNPIGIMVHSTGANNPYLRRYVQSRGSNPEIEKCLGVNKNANDWNRSNVDACVHAFIGKDINDDVKCVQTLQFSKRGWHAGSGKLGSANDTHISFEICEDGLHDEKYFNAAMRKAQELCAWLCKLYSIDPYTHGALICHQDGYKLGIASNHGDIYNWLNVFGKDMDWFRKEVRNIMDGEVPAWAADAWMWAKNQSIINDGRPNDPCTRAEIVTMLYRYQQAVDAKEYFQKNK